MATTIAPVSVARSTRCVAPDARACQSASARMSRPSEDEPFDRLTPIVLAGLPATRVVRAERGPIDDRARLLARGQREPVVLDDPGDGARSHLARPDGDRRRGRAHVVAAQIRARADTRGREAVGGEPAARVHDRRLAAPAFQLSIVDQVPQLTGDEAGAPPSPGGGPRGG